MTGRVLEKRLRRAALLASAGAVLSAWPHGPVLAQLAPVDRGINPEQLAPPPPKTAGDISAPAAFGPSLIAPAGAARIIGFVRRVEITGRFPELEVATQALLATLEGRRASLADVYAVAARLQAAYAEAGFPLVTVAVATRSLEAGLVRIVVTDGFVEDLDLSSVNERSRELVRSRLQPLVGQRRVRLSEIQRRVLLLGELAGVVGASSTRPGRAPGGVVLAITVTEKTIVTQQALDNQLPGALGALKITNTVSVNNAFGLGENLHAEAATSKDVDRVLKGRALFEAFGVGFALPVGTDGLTLVGAYNNVRTNVPLTPGFSIDTTDVVASEYQRAYLRANYPILLTLQQTLRVQFGFDFVQSSFGVGPTPVQVDPLGAPVNRISLDRYDDVRVAVEHSVALPFPLPGRATTAAFFTHGIGGREADLLPLSRPGASPFFTKLRLQEVLVQALPEAFALTLAARAQTSFGRPLMLPEQLSLDGSDALSGFDSGTLNVDTGGVGRAEIARPFAVGLGVSQLIVSPYAFAAYGRGVHERPLVGENRVISAASFGGGLRTAAVVPGSPYQQVFNVEFAKNYANAARAGYKINFIYALLYSGDPRITAAPTPTDPPTFRAAWSGFYAGLNTGYAFDAQPRRALAATPTLTNLDARSGLPYSTASAISLGYPALSSAEGVLSGAQVGYGVQGERFAAGVEIDAQGSAAKARTRVFNTALVSDGFNTDTIASTVLSSKSVDWLATARLRVGYLPLPNVLAYVTGGLAAGGVRDATAIGQAITGPIFGVARANGGFAQSAATLVGYTFGTGLEFMVSPSLSLKTEYLYYNLGKGPTTSIPVTQSFGGFFNSVLAANASRFGGQLVRAGLNYHFDGERGADRRVAAPFTPRWTGVYAGVNTGYAFDAAPGFATQGLLTNNALDSIFAPQINPPIGVASAQGVTGAARAPAQGFLGGGQIGYARTVDRMLLGVEAELDGSGARGRGGYQNTSAFTAAAGGAVSQNSFTTIARDAKSLDWFGALRGRAGFLANPALLLYATGGVAIGGVSADAVLSQQAQGVVGGSLVSSPSFGAAAKTRVGWTLGGGGEWEFAPNLSLKLEYLYYDLGRISVTASPQITSFGPSDVVSPISRLRAAGQIARAGLNYHFDLLGEPAAFAPR